MKAYEQQKPRLITWRDIRDMADIPAKTRRALLDFFARLGERKRLLVWSLWRQAEQSVPASLPDDERTAYNNLHRRRDSWNDLLFLAACHIVQAQEYTTAQAALLNDMQTRAAVAKRQRYARSKKQTILRHYDLIVKLWKKYGSWGTVCETIKKRPRRSGEPDPFRELRQCGEIDPKYLATVISVESKFRT